MTFFVLAERNSDEALFTHGREFLNALSSGLTHFEIFENKTKNPEMTNLNDLNDMRTSFLYDSHVSYTLLSDPSGYVNLDNQKHLASFGLIHELAESHITHCGHEQTLSHGTFLVGSARGSWMRDLATEHAMAKLMAHLSPSHLKERKDKGLTILRRVVRTEEIEVIRSDITEICSKLFTESVHPMELFSQMKLETISKSPFQYAQMRKNESLEKENPQRSRNGMSNMQLQPDSPIITCDPNNYYFGGKGGGYSVGYSLTEGCAEYYSDFTAYSFNYDLKTGKQCNCIFLDKALQLLNSIDFLDLCVPDQSFKSV